MAELVTLAEAKAHLDKTSNADDAELIGFVEAATAVVEDYVGPMSVKTFVKREPSRVVLLLDHTPVVSLVSVAPWLATGTTYNVADLVFDPVTGVVERRDGCGFTGGPFKVTYTAGRVAVPPNVRLAALVIIAHMWETQRGRLPRLPNSSEMAPVPIGLSYAVPRRALELLRPFARGPFVA